MSKELFVLVVLLALTFAVAVAVESRGNRRSRRLEDDLEAARVNHRAECERLRGQLDGALEHIHEKTTPAAPDAE
jgi:hypothetical protein